MISLVVPVLNEEQASPIFYEAVRSFDGFRDLDVEIVFVDDGSTDGTAAIIKEFCRRDPLVKLVEFTRNFGKEPALLAGLEIAKGDAVIPIDVDLQDPLEIIPEMIERWKAGADIVLAKRVNRDSDNFLKRKTAEYFYKVHNYISALQIEENVGDFRLISRPMVENIKLMPERNLFMKGVLSWVGGRTEVVEYTRLERVVGQSKFNGWKLWNLAVEGITSFSTVPLRIWTYIGAFIAAGAVLYGFWMVIQKLIFGISVEGYASLITSIMFLGGVQLAGMGVIGEYIGRIYLESKQRPRYLVRQIYTQRDTEAAPADPASRTVSQSETRGH